MKTRKPRSAGRDTKSAKQLDWTRRNVIDKQINKEKYVKVDDKYGWNSVLGKHKCANVSYSLKIIEDLIFC